MSSPSSPLSRFLRTLPNSIAAVILLQTLFYKFSAAPGDGGQLFILAVLVAGLAAFILYRDRAHWMALLRTLRDRRSPST